MSFWALLMMASLAISSSFAQTSLFRFSVEQAGVYRISVDQAKKMGFTSLSEIGVFGYPGMLPQKLDSVQLKLQEIPALESNGQLYFFLEGPNTLSIDPKEGISYSHHLFADSLSYLFGKKSNPKRITPTPASSTVPNPDQIWYSWVVQKEEVNNILNSGRSWYSDPIRQGQSLAINLRLKSEANAPWILHGKVMAQSSSQAQINVLTGNLLLGSVELAAIPNTTFGIKGREESFRWEVLPPGNAIGQIRLTFQGAGSESAGFLDYLAVGVPVANKGIVEGIIESLNPALLALPQNLETWEVSNFFSPKAISRGTGLSASGKKWVIFSPEKTFEIKEAKPVSESLRTNSQAPELLIITSSSLLSSAEKLRSHKESLGIATEVVTLESIYTSFSYGNPDVSAIRNMIAFRFHSGKKLKNVLILGKGTFDYKKKIGGRPNLVPIYTSRSSLNPLTTYSSDDYLGLIDWGQGNWEESREGDELMQIGVGRLPAINFTEANEMVEKIIRYETQPNPGLEIPEVTFLADDADKNIHVRDAEVHAKYLEENHPQFRLNKLYLDRYEQEGTGSNQSSPQAKSALEKTLDQGTLILNYIGHGNETTLTAEEIFKVSDIANWSKQDQLALWVTATCEFGRHDSPLIRSAAEELLFAQGKGAIGLLTTGRPVFSSVNFTLNEAFIKEVFRLEDGLNRDLGSIFKDTKNKSLNGSLNRSFSLLGDPSMKLAVPELRAEVIDWKNTSTNASLDTLPVLQEIELSAEIKDPISGATLSGFSGRYQLELRDKPSEVQTLGNENAPFRFEEENLLLFKGEGNVSNGKLTAKLLLPSSTKPDFGKGNLRIYASDPNSGLQAYGSADPVLGGKPNPSQDKVGPTISLQLNGKSEGPFLFPATQIKLNALLADPSGINVSSFLPEESLTLQVNGLAPIVLNESFIAKDGNYKQGELTTTITGLIEGKNTLIFRASDMVGNESVAQVEVEVRGSEQLQILSHTVFPNPASVESHFNIQHNRPGENLTLTFEVYSMNGNILVKEVFRLVKVEEIIRDLSWFFFQSQTKYPAKGTYIYKLTLQSETDLSVDWVSGKLVIR